MAGALLLPRQAVLRAAHGGMNAAAIAEFYQTTEEMARFRINATGAAIQRAVAVSPLTHPPQRKCMVPKSGRSCRRDTASIKPFDLSNGRHRRQRSEFEYLWHPRAQLLSGALRRSVASRHRRLRRDSIGRVSAESTSAPGRWCRISPAVGQAPRLAAVAARPSPSLQWREQSRRSRSRMPYLVAQRRWPLLLR
jgi:hypothetical protein